MNGLSNLGLLPDILPGWKAITRLKTTGSPYEIEETMRTREPTKAEERWAKLSINVVNGDWQLAPPDVAPIEIARVLIAGLTESQVSNLAGAIEMSNYKPEENIE